MRGAIIFIAIMALAVESPGEEQPDDHLLVSIDTAMVEISARPSGRHAIRLPSLEFVVRLEPRCAIGKDADSVSISVADTRLRIGRDPLAEQPIIETTIRIPGEQIGPLVIEGFCVAGEDAANDAFMEVRDALTAQLSLRCSEGSRQSIVYWTEALTITLKCETPAASQVSSPAATTRL
jgi:hypothetical protein